MRRRRRREPATLIALSGKERFLQSRLVAAGAVRHVAFRLLAPVLPLLIRPRRTPARLLIAPQDIRVADPTLANDIYAGHFALAGRVVNGHGRSPFELHPPNEAWAEALHGFSWLRHLRAADTALARANARALVDDWITVVRLRPHAIAWRPAVVARRLLSWLSQSPVILDGADRAFYRRLLRSLMQQAAYLQRQLASGLEGDDRLWAALALAETNLCVDKTVSGRRSSGPLLDELDRQILPDGGHISRNPQITMDLLLDLLPLRQAYAARGAEVPPILLNAIDRMMPLLRLFRHADGSLARFNGMGVSQPEALATILSFDDARPLPPGNAPYAGYQRLAGGRSVVLIDTGPPPPMAFSRRAHAGALSFEFSTAGQSVVVNCGRPATDRGMIAAARSTAAHSALIVADTSSARILPPGRGSFGMDGAMVGGPRAVPVQRDLVEGWHGVEASQDGYRALGVMQTRRLLLAESGLVLHGEDRLASDRSAGTRELGVVLRFHLHPLARPSYAPETGILITLPQGVVWRFDAPDHAVTLEESIFFGSPEGPRRSEQIVVQATVATAASVPWSFAAVSPA